MGQRLLTATQKLWRVG